MSEPSPDLQNKEFDKDKFDAVLRKIIATKPLPLKDVIGTSPRSSGKSKESVQSEQ